MYPSAAWYGTPHIGMAAPFSLLREVSVISSSRAAVTASSKNSS